MVSALTRKMLRDIRDLKGQVISIALVVCMGVAVLIGSLSTYQSLSFAQQYFYKTYHFADVFSGLKRAPNNVGKRISQLPGVKQVNLRISKEVNLDLPDMDEPAVGQFISLPKTRNTVLNDVHIQQGRYLDPNKNDEILVSDAFAKAHHLKPGDSLVGIVNGHRETFRVVGIAISPEYVYAIRPGSLMPDNAHFGIMWLNYDAMASAFDMDGAFNNVVVQLSTPDDQAEVIAGIDQLLNRYGGLGAYGRQSQISHQFLSNEFEQLKFLASVIPAIFIGISAFLLNMVTGRLVALQREHIAILKANGYSNWVVGLYYLKLVFLIVFLGTLLGIGFGAWMGSAMPLMYKLYFVFPIFDYRLALHVPLLGFIISMIAASIGAVAAVRWVVTLPPSVAMRPPVPPEYHSSVFERYGLLKPFSSSFKMIFRNIIRKPAHNILATLGIGCGVAIVVMGLFWSDSINYIINAQFMLAERGHILVSFTDPVKKTALFELRQQPGVLAVEGYRIAPVRLRSEHRSYLTALYGYDSHTEQRILLDPQLNAIPIPKNQLLISKTLANILHVQPGDTLQIEVLEGKRHRTQTKLAQVVDDFIGLGAYTDQTMVDRLLDEHQLMSMASILFDANYEQTLYQTLKEMPHVASVTIKSKMIEVFEQTFAEHLLIFTSFLAGFAVVIAIGIVYNSARIALSERAWELASLRVLGFTRNEVTKLLLGELSAQLLFGIPLGLWFGYQLAKLSIHLIPAEMIRLPLIINSSTYAFSTLTVIISGILSAIVIRRHINRLNLVEVLKTLD